MQKEVSKAGNESLQAAPLRESPIVERAGSFLVYC